MNYKSFDDLSRDIKKNLHKVHLGDYDLVVGIPRSGMIPAYMIGLYLNVHVTDLESFMDNRPVKKGFTRKAKHDLVNAQDARKVLIVDDSIMSGNSLAKTLEGLPDKLRSKVTTLAIYSNKAQRKDIDNFLEVVPFPRAFEWNIFHRDLLSHACVDIDGVLCLDPTEYENDDGERYVNFLLNAKPHIIPTYKIHSLVTSRLEKYRPQTEAWLKEQGVEYDHLIMLDLPDKESRQKLGAHATHKASYFKRMANLEIFIESDISQSQKIMELTGKPVYCVDHNCMFSPSSIALGFKNPKIMMKRTRSRIALYMPAWLKRFIRPIYSRFFKSA